MNTKQVSLLSGLLILWVVVICWQWFTPTEAPRVPLTNVSGPKTVAQAVPSEWTVNQPKPAPESPAVPKRNIFTPLSERQEQLILASVKLRASKAVQNWKIESQASDPATVASVKREPASPAPAVALPAPPPSPQELAEIAERQQREQRIAKLREQAGQYRMIGLSERGGVKQAFVEKGTDIYVVRQGETLDGLFMVSIIELGGVKIRDAEFNVEYMMPLKKDGG